MEPKSVAECRRPQTPPTHLREKSFATISLPLKLYSFRRRHRILCHAASHLTCDRKVQLIPARSVPEADMNLATKRMATLASCALALTLIMSGIALARDEDDYYRRGNPDQARNYGYQNGYNDGAKHGRHEGREHDPNDYRTPDW